MTILLADLSNQSSINFNSFCLSSNNNNNNENNEIIENTNNNINNNFNNCLMDYMNSLINFDISQNPMNSPFRNIIDNNHQVNDIIMNSKDLQKQYIRKLINIIIYLNLKFKQEK